MAFSDASTIPALFATQAFQFGAKPLFWVKQAGRYQPISWDQARETVRALSLYFLHAGVNPGDRVLILSENRPEWNMADVAIQSVGAWTVPIYASLTEGGLLPILHDCEPVIAIASTAEQARKLRALQADARSLRAVIVLDQTALEPPRELSWDAALRQGRDAGERLTERLHQRVEQLAPDHTATLIYTSGTTGEPKGVMLSHKNFLSNAAACLKVTPIDQRDLHLSFLPLSHVFERMAGWYLMMLAGASVAFAESMDTIPDNMAEVKPTVMLGVPRFFEKLHARIQDGLSQAPPKKQKVIRWALAIGRQASAYRLHRQALPLGLRLRYAIANSLVFRKLRQRLGGRLRFFVSGSAPLSKAIGEFFYYAGIVILEGYGLTETSPVIAVNRLHALQFGTVGQPVPGVEVRLAEDGEILTRGPHIMQGYYRKPEATAEVIVDGWLHTGDIGQLDPQGFLSITDRKKDLIKTAGGKFVAPQKLENLFTLDPYISQAFVYGDRERYCVALIVPNFQRLAGHAKEQGLGLGSPQELACSPAIREFLWKRIQAIQQPLAGFEQVKAIALLDQEFTQANGELTPTLKAKRATIAARYQDLLQQLYQPSPTPAS